MCELTEGELMILGFADPGFKGFAMTTREEVGVIVSDLTPTELHDMLEHRADAVS